MKKFSAICLAASAFAALACASATEEAVSKFMNEQFAKSQAPEGITVEAKDYEKLANGWQSVRIDMKASTGAVLQSGLLFSDGHFVTPILINAKTGENYKTKFDEEIEKHKQAAMKTALPEYVKSHKNAIKLGNKGGAVTVVFSDPDCPFCRKHILTLAEQLKRHDVLMVLMPLPMHKDALNKSALLLEEAAKLGEKASDEQKIELLKKYFADGEFAEASEAAKSALSDAAEDAFELGINYTPAIFEDIKL